MVDAVIMEGSMENYGNGGKKRKQLNELGIVLLHELEVVLDD